MNNDRVYWQRKCNGTFGVVHLEKDVVGHCISTKAVGSDQRVDITNLYKHAKGENPHVCHEKKPTDFELKIIIPLCAFIRYGGKVRRFGHGLSLRRQTMRAPAAVRRGCCRQSHHAGRRTVRGQGRRALHQSEKQMQLSSYPDPPQPSSGHVPHRSPPGFPEEGPDVL